MTFSDMESVLACLNFPIASVGATDASTLPKPGQARRTVARETACEVLGRRVAQAMGQINPLVFVNLKGGVGKTTLVTQIAMRACQYGLEVCVVDLDPQASSTLALAGDLPDGVPVFLDVWDKPATEVGSALIPVAPGLKLLPSSLDNTLLDARLAHPAQQKKAVRDVCRAVSNAGADLVLVDCPPTLGTGVISALCAARQVIIPICADAFSLKGLKLTMAELQAICETFSLELPRVRVLFNRFDRRERLQDRLLAQTRAQYGDVMMRSVLRTSTHYARALSERRSVFDDARKTPAAEDIESCLMELIQSRFASSLKV